MVDTFDREKILLAIAEVEKQISSLLKQKEDAETTLQSLKKRLETGDGQNIPHPKSFHPQHVSTPSNLTREEKVSLFLRLFRGRDDVYPKLWHNRKTNKKGYSPACANEWVHGVCEKPRVKCGECPNQAFLPVTADVIRNHLQGRHVIGVYPMLTNETCWFLAADFDKEAWQDDILAFAETCRNVGVPYAMERSRSGNGAHIWFFFNSPVSASTARKMGTYMLTETMARRHQPSMASYDRLFQTKIRCPTVASAI